MNLTPNFTLAELVASTRAAQLKIDNTPPPDVARKLLFTAEMLERIRTHIGAPVSVSSGYRCRKLNAAVGGVTSSDHLTGEAADIAAPRFGSAFKLASALAPFVASLGIGQLILEGIKGKQWVHVSTQTPERLVNRIITVTDSGARAGIHPVS